MHFGAMFSYVDKERKKLNKMLTYKDLDVLDRVISRS